MILCLIFYSLAISQESCILSPKRSFSIQKLDGTIKPVKIPISDLGRTYREFQGQYIETTGIIGGGFEEFAIYPDTILFIGKSYGFWLEINPELNFDHYSFKKIDGKRVRIKGIIDTTKTGHLGSYLATIDSIYFWAEQEHQ